MEGNEDNGNALPGWKDSKCCALILFITLRCGNCFLLEPGKDQENSIQCTQVKVRLLLLVLSVVSLGLNFRNRG